MSPTQDHQVHTAKDSDTQKHRKIVRRPFSAQVDCAEWARDVSAHVTRTMDNSTPYDHTTPPLSPPNNIQSQIPREPRDVRGLPAIDVSRQLAAYAHTPRPADHIVPRDSLCNGSRKPGRYSARGTFATRTQRSQNLQDRASLILPPISTTVNHQKEGRPLNYNFRFPVHQDDILQILTTPWHNKPRYRGVDVMPTAVMMAPQMPTIPKAPTSPMSKLDTNSKVTPEVTKCFSPMKRSNSSKSQKSDSSWGSRVRKRPGEIFDAAFSFWSPSRRRADMSHPVSPRTSVSSDSGSPTPTPDEFHIKKQRIDSSGTKVTTSPTHNKNGYNHEPAPTGPANIWLEEDTTRFSPIATSADPHPGRPVDFSFPSYSNLQNLQCRRKESIEGYHTYLEEERRRSSDAAYSDPWVFAIELEASKSHAKEVEERVDKEARILGLTTNIPSCTLKRASTTNHGQRRLCLPSTASRSSTLCRTNSDNSTDRFLSHVRASQQARQRRRMSEEQGLNDARVFVHGNENFLLGDPL
jgi:hypothetical protein